MGVWDANHPLWRVIQSVVSLVGLYLLVSHGTLDGVTTVDGDVVGGAWLLREGVGALLRGR